MIGAARRSIPYVAGGIGVVAVTLFIGWWQVDGPGRTNEPASVAANPLPFSFYERDFELTDHFGRTLQPKDWIGRPTLVFFGFTYCPDVCPTTLSNISGWLEELGAETSLVRAAFITVDPDRDTVQVMADYVSNFHPAIVGYTGSPGEIAAAASSFKVTFERVSSNNEYTVNHTASVFLYDTLGRFVSTIDLHEPAENALPKMRRILN